MLVKTQLTKNNLRMEPSKVPTRSEQVCVRPAGHEAGGKPTTRRLRGHHSCWDFFFFSQ